MLIEWLGIETFAKFLQDLVLGEQIDNRPHVPQRK